MNPKAAFCAHFELSWLKSFGGAGRGNKCRLVIIQSKKRVLVSCRK